MIANSSADDRGKEMEKCAVNTVYVEDLNQPKIEWDAMILDSAPAEAIKPSHADLKDHEKGVESSGCVDIMILDISPSKAPKQLSATMEDYEKGMKKPLKRKKASAGGNVINQDKGSLIIEYHRELDDLFEFYNEVSGYKLHIESGTCPLNNSVIACLLEESSLPFSKLVDVIFGTLKTRVGVTLAYVRSTVLSVGQRAMYGIANPVADVLEDESKSCLWCWETRDMKLLPTTQRKILNIRRVARKRIHERISALSEMLSVLSLPQSHDNYNSDLIKASAKLRKALNGKWIRSFIEKSKQKNGADITIKEAKLNEEFTKETERSKQDADKEKKRTDHEFQKEKYRSEKELKRLQEEAEKEEKRREKEEAELEKQLKKQKEEAEREQRRREKEAIELKRKLSIQKQAAIMERFLKRPKSNNSSDQTEQGSSFQNSMSESSLKKEDIVNGTTSSMDRTFSQQDSFAIEDLRKSHVAGWHKLYHCNRTCHWGVRRNPKIELIKELKLQRSSSEAERPEKVTTPYNRVSTSHVNCDMEPCFDKLVNGFEECMMSSDNHHDTDFPSVQLNKKLLQFDKCHRPAYYGTWPKKSGVVGPKHPFKKDPYLDYDVDSDLEWEEEDPGESLSDCDNNNEEEQLEEEISNIEEEDGSEDSFLVPDGYLSENEGVQVDRSSDDIVDEARNSTSCNSEVESEEAIVLLQQQKCLHNLTEKALQRGQLLVISNLMHEKAELMMAGDLKGTSKIEHICLQALRMRVLPGGSVIVVSTNHNPSKEDQEVSQSQSRNNTTSTTTAAAAVTDSDLSEFVRSIQSNSQGMSKVVESLQCKFPTTPKSLLRNKVREISNFVDNRWQVKEDILNRLGFSPDKGRKPKGIVTYFSKRCLPPEEESVNIPESSPQPCSKTMVLHDGDNQSCPGTCSKSKVPHADDVHSS